MRESLRRLASEDCMERKSGSCRRVRVELLDGDHITVDLDRKATGLELLERVCSELDVVERDYFGLARARPLHPRDWLRQDQPLTKAFRNEPWDVRFGVRFYPPEPAELRDEHARYQLALAVRRDLVEGRLMCSSITMALLASYTLQAELGDYEPGHVSPALVARHAAAPVDALTPDLESKLHELYRKHKGQSPAEAELNYLEQARRLPLYGAERHSARDIDDVDIAIVVAARGLAVYRDGLVMNRFPWAMITRLRFSAREFTLGLRPGPREEAETRVAFRLPTPAACKALWRSAVDHHVFFRREAPVRVARCALLPALGARATSCRRTLRQLRDDAQDD